jgi:ribosome-binding factor A
LRKNSIKNTRINGEVQKALSEIIRSELKDPRIHPMTSVVMVQVTPDLKFCKAYVSVLAGEEQAKDTLRGLKSAVGYIRTQLARKVNLRNTPELSFVLDQSIEYGVRMSRLIDEVAGSDSEKEECAAGDRISEGEHGSQEEEKEDTASI